MNESQFDHINKKWKQRDYVENAYIQNVTRHANYTKIST